MCACKPHYRCPSGASHSGNDSDNDSIKIPKSQLP
eukprot:CAMPEP_0194775758 /NCGR_PEP_ID=MMETSP0323_2-20130528/61230_1 /TAXON_ID=2866 ORGANISM="Crypthecodinium cohnii, Strain Seligo" /NCGR_SAMPLE_ID=MMETSP0323_2 /ASSEMBLY_ACC=CAM_ASM_000346 /LENGTH=34 /DNA_ID= /DNA_START= /DNA_END= /DNA_ORIENTATION=